MDTLSEYAIIVWHIQRELGAAELLLRVFE
jgi:hypothetical protein